MTRTIDPTEVVMVPFAGEGSGTDVLTWGQQHIWNAMHELGSPMNMCATRELGPGARVQDFVDELRFYLSRYQSMRTLLRLVPGGLPLQVVVEAGEAPLEIVDIPECEDPARVAALISAENEDIPFDYEHEFPIRMVLVRRGGALTHMVMTICHFATDAAGAMVMYTDFVGRDPLADGPGKPAGMHPLELAARQRMAPALRQSDASLRYWESMLRTIPQDRFPPPSPVEPGTGRYCQVRLDSPAMLLALRVIAKRVGVDVSTALLGVVAVVIGRATESNPVVAQMVVNNRFRPGFAEIVSNVSQAGLLVVDVAEVTVDEAVARARQASTRACKNAYFDFARWKQLVAQVNRDRGGEVDLRCYYNDRSSQSRTEGVGREPTRAEIEAALARTTAPVWTDLPYFNERLMVTIDDPPGAIGLIVLADTSYYSRQRMLETARALESLAVEAAGDPATATGVRVTAAI